MRITLLNQFYRPDIAPTAHLAASLAEHRAALGDEVSVVTSKGGYVAAATASAEAAPAAAASRATENPRIYRIWTPQAGKQSLCRRLIDYATFYVAAAWRMLVLPRQDVIVSLTTPPYIAWAAVWHKLLHRNTRVILWSMDCYPDVAERAGIIRQRGWLATILRASNRMLFRRLDHVVCLDAAMADLVRSQYAPRTAAGRSGLGVTIIPNWEDGARFPADVCPPRWPEADRLGLAGKFVLLYLGNTGVGHAFETVLDAAEALRGKPVIFLFIGGGSRWESIQNEKQRRGLDNVILVDYIAKDQTPAVMAAADAALITLRDEALGVMSPSKLHSNLAMGLPVVYIGPADSNVDHAIARYGCGASLRAGDVEGLTAFILRLSSDPGLQEALRKRARSAFDEAYCDARTLPQFDRLFDQLLSADRCTRLPLNDRG